MDTLLYIKLSAVMALEYAVWGGVAAGACGATAGAAEV